MMTLFGVTTVPELEPKVTVAPAAGESVMSPLPAALLLYRLTRPPLTKSPPPNVLDPLIVQVPVEAVVFVMVDAPPLKEPLNVGLEVPLMVRFAPLITCPAPARPPIV